MFFNGWFGIGRVLLVGVLAYGSLIFLLRISGKRTLSKMNAFDLIVTVALGSTLATILLSKDVPLVEGVVAFGLLILLQFAITWVSVRSRKFSRLVKATPTLLYYRGQFLTKVMKDERVVAQEIRAAVRAEGISTMDDVLGVVIETDGSFTVIRQDSASDLTALQEVENIPSPAEASTETDPDRRDTST